jgi:hypothetical protein
MSGAIPLHPPYAFMDWIGNTLPIIIITYITSARYLKIAQNKTS